MAYTEKRLLDIMGKNYGIYFEIYLTNILG